MPLRDEACQGDPGQLTSIRNVLHLAAAPPTRCIHGGGASSVPRGGAMPGVADAVPQTDPRQRKLAPELYTLDGARAGYVAALQGVYPLIDAQLKDVVCLLDVLLGSDRPAAGGPLDDARTAYLVCLRQSCRGIEEQLLELARACTDLFAPALGLPSAARPSPRRSAPARLPAAGAPPSAGLCGRAATTSPHRHRSPAN